MIRENLHFGEEARAKLMQGVSKVARAVGVTLGTGGSNSLIECIPSPGSFPTNDGYQIANAIRLEDVLEEMGRKILIEAINKANKASGDGSSTTCVLTAAILEEGVKHIGEISPMQIKKEIEACFPIIEKSLEKQRQDVTVDTVGQVASISAEDESIGSMIQEIYQEIGKEGLISWEASKTPYDWYSLGMGLKIDGATYVSHYMCDLTPNGLKKEATLEDVPILLARKKITAESDFRALIPAMIQEGKDKLVVFVDEIEPTMIHSFIRARDPANSNPMRILVVKMPIILNDEWWVDLAYATGATVIDDACGIPWKKVGLEQLGNIKKIKVDEEATYLDGIKDLTRLEQGGGMIFDYVNSLREEGSDDSLRRIARLNTKTAVYHVGAHTEGALKERIDKVEDAINSATVALQAGIVVGGGISFLNAARELPDNVGGNILKIALRKPTLQIMQNAGKDVSDEKCLFFGFDTLIKTYGFNSKTGQVEDLMNSGIVNAKSVDLNAVKNAIGVAASILTIGTIVTLPRETETVSGMIEKMVDQRTSVQQ
jgi:chaperonin GroEL